MASLQERSKKMREEREANRLKANRIKDSLKLEELKAKDKTSNASTSNKRKESGISRVNRKNQIKQVEKRLNENKPTPKPAPKPAPKPKANRATDKGGREAAPGSEGFKPTKTDIGPNMNQINKPDAKPAPKKEEFDRMQAARDQMKRARESMGMGSRFGYKKGGSVKHSCRRGDGICKKGKTKGRMV